MGAVHPPSGAAGAARSTAVGSPPRPCCVVRVPPFPHPRRPTPSVAFVVAPSTHILPVLCWVTLDCAACRSSSRCVGLPPGGGGVGWHRPVRGIGLFFPSPSWWPRRATRAWAQAVCCHPAARRPCGGVGFCVVGVGGWRAGNRRGCERRCRAWRVSHAPSHLAKPLPSPCRAARGACMPRNFALHCCAVQCSLGWSSCPRAGQC